MSNLYRFGISLERSLIEAFDSHIKSLNYVNRSEAIRDLIREELSRKSISEGSCSAGALTMVYNHHKRELVNTLIDIQHDFQSIIISTQHVHLDHHNCLEIIAVKGDSKKIEKLASEVKSQIGVTQVHISLSATEM